MTTTQTAISIQVQEKIDDVYDAIDRASIAQRSYRRERRMFESEYAADGGRDVLLDLIASRRKTVEAEEGIQEALMTVRQHLSNDELLSILSDIAEYDSGR